MTDVTSKPTLSTTAYTSVSTANCLVKAYGPVVLNVGATATGAPAASEPGIGLEVYDRPLQINLAADDTLWVLAKLASFSVVIVPTA
jgi:hypothetical protein